MFVKQADRGQKVGQTDGAFKLKCYVKEVLTLTFQRSLIMPDPIHFNEQLCLFFSPGSQVHDKQFLISHVYLTTVIEARNAHSSCL